MAKKVKKKKKAKKRKPRTHGSSAERNNKGQFVKGNKCSVGNASSGDRRTKWLKKALYDAVTEQDITDIAKKLVEKAKQGDVPAAKELFDRLWGRAKQEIEGTLNLIPTDEKTPTEEELLEQLQKVQTAGTGIDTKSIEGNGNSH